MRDAELERYVSVIEEHLGRRRGRDHTLSPPDFALARHWLEAGIPVEDVLAAVEAVEAEGHDPTSLALCRRRVEGRRSRAPIRAVPGRQPSTASSADPADDATVSGAEDRPGTIRRVLESLEPARAALFPQTRAALAALRSPGDREGFARLEEALGWEAVAALDSAARAALERRLARAAGRQRGRVSDAALAAARERQLRAAALRALGLEPG